MTDFQTGEAPSTALTTTLRIPDDSLRSAEPDAGVPMIRRMWRWFTTGAGLVATAVCVSAIVSLILAWTFFSGLLYRDHAEEGRTVSQRILDLTALETGSRSALGCLDVVTGDPLEDVCERTVFASPESVAGANAFVAARLSVLEDAVAYANEAHSHYAGVILALRQAVENDQFGLVAHVLAARYGCSASQCSAFALLSDTSKIVANFNARTFETLVARYEPSWEGQPTASPLPGQPPMATVTPGPSANLRLAPATGSGAPPLKGLYVPPASSIPAVSIMTEEPRGPPTQAAPSSHPVAAPRASPKTAAPPPPPINLSPDQPNPG